jgi:hypothetical protein
VCVFSAAWWRLSVSRVLLCAPHWPPPSLTSHGTPGPSPHTGTAHHHTRTTVRRESKTRGIWPILRGREETRELLSPLRSPLSLSPSDETLLAMSFVMLCGVFRLIASAPSASLLPLVAERVAHAAPNWTHTQAQDTEATDAEATQVLPALLYTLHLTLNSTHRSAHHIRPYALPP